MSIYERLWNDRMDIYRSDDVTVSNITSSSRKLIQSDAKCHYSAGSLADTGEGVPTLISSHKLFCAAATIKEGDKVVVTQHKSGLKVTLIVGEGFPYSGGMQYSVKRNDKV